MPLSASEISAARQSFDSPVIAADAAAYPAMPRRPQRALSTPQLLRVALSSTLAAFAEELFDEPIAERRFGWGRCFRVSHPDGIRRGMQDNLGNYPRIHGLHRAFAFTA